MANSRHSSHRKKPDKSAKAKADARPYACVLPGPWELNSVIVLLCVVGTAVVYAADLHVGFFRFEDLQYVRDNAWIRVATWVHIRQIVSYSHYLNYSPLHVFCFLLYLRS